MSKLLTSTRDHLKTYRSAARECLLYDRGQSLLELALVLPAFFMLMIGFINFCMIMFGLCNVSFACRQADRYVCLHSQTSLAPAAQSNVDSVVAPYIFKYPSNVYTDTLSYGGGGNVVGGTATVKVTITYNVVIAFMTIPAIKLTSTASGTITQ